LSWGESIGEKTRRTGFAADEGLRKRIPPDSGSIISSLISASGFIIWARAPRAFALVGLFALLPRGMTVCCFEAGADVGLFALAVLLFPLILPTAISTPNASRCQETRSTEAFICSHARVISRVLGNDAGERHSQKNDQASGPRPGCFGSYPAPSRFRGLGFACGICPRERSGSSPITCIAYWSTSMIPN
jgi:hypothetical protein